MKSEQIKEEVQEEVVTEAETAPTADTLEAKVQQLEELNAAQQDQYKRVLAEYDNFRKRSAKEKETIYADVTAQTVSEFLPVLDNLERAAAREDASQGAQLIYKQFCDVLSKLKVEPCAKVGDAFDPNLHNAVMHIEDETLGDNVIAEVLLQGYTRNGRLVRPAMVKVAN